MRKEITLAMAGVAFLAGCDGMGNKPYGPPPEASKPTVPYHIEFDTKAVRPNPAGVALPAIIYMASPALQEKRAALVVRFDAAGAKNDQAAKDRFVSAPIDIPGTGKTFPPNYMDSVDTGLAKLLAERCLKGKVKISVALVRSSIKPDPDETEIDAKRLSDWLPGEVTFKNPHPKC